MGFREVEPEAQVCLPILLGLQQERSLFSLFPEVSHLAQLVQHEGLCSPVPLGPHGALLRILGGATLTPPLSVSPRLSLKSLKEGYQAITLESFRLVRVVRRLDCYKDQNLQIPSFMFYPLHDFNSTHILKSELGNTL